MTTKREIAPVRVLPDGLANKIAAGEVVERPASVVKELLENSLDAGATRITVRVEGAGQKLIEVIDNGHGMTQQDALLAIERHATSKIRKAEDLDNIRSFGFRGEALPSIAAVSHFELVTRRAEDKAASRIRVDGGVMRDVSEMGLPPGTRITVNSLYYNTPVRAKFLKGIATELGHCIDTVQRCALANVGTGFQFYQNGRLLLDIPENAGLRERIARIWGLSIVESMVEIHAEFDGLTITGMAGLPSLTRSSRSHQFFFVNGRPVLSRPVQYGFHDAYQGLVMVGRYPVGILLLNMNPRLVDVNIHPAKREVRFRDDRAVHDAVRDGVRATLEQAAPRPSIRPAMAETQDDPLPRASFGMDAVPMGEPVPLPKPFTMPAPEAPLTSPAQQAASLSSRAQSQIPGTEPSRLDEAPEHPSENPAAPLSSLQPAPLYAAVGPLSHAPLQVFGTYLLVPEKDRLLIIDQHALHERLCYESLQRELSMNEYASQQLAVPLLVEVQPSQVATLEENRALFRTLGIDIESFGGATFQVTSICHLYEESRVKDAIFAVLKQLEQGDLFEKKEEITADLLRLAVRACRGAVKAGDELDPRERAGLLEGLRRLRPPYTCPHGRPIITEITLDQMEKGFRRKL